LATQERNDIGDYWIIYQLFKQISESKDDLDLMG
jgi:hypothetical protein